MGKSTISMVIFNSYVKLPEGSIRTHTHTVILLTNGMMMMMMIPYVVLHIQWSFKQRNHSFWPRKTPICSVGHCQSLSCSILSLSFVYIVNIYIYYIYIYVCVYYTYIYIYVLYKTICVYIYTIRIYSLCVYIYALYVYTICIYYIYKYITGIQWLLSPTWVCLKLRHLQLGRPGPVTTLVVAHVDGMWS